MSDSKTIIGDEMIEVKLKNKSDILNISVDELIDRYIRIGLFCDDYYDHSELTKEERIERSRKRVEKDIANGFPPKKHNFDVFVGRWDKSDD